jgi:Holliday junction resolvasome RuvABC endonuclease subunit
LIDPLLAAAGWGVVEAKPEEIGQLFSCFLRLLSATPRSEPARPPL